MKFETHINMDNAAFENDVEIVDILKDIITNIETNGVEIKKQTLLDSYGNKVGFFEIS